MISIVTSNDLKDLLEDSITPRSTTTYTSTLTQTTPRTLIMNKSSGNMLVPHPPPAIKTNLKYFNKSSPKKRKAEEVSSIPIGDDNTEWKCPNITGSRSLECGCDLPHTLRCNGDLHGLTVLAENLRVSPYSVSLLDCSLRNVTFLSDAKIFEGVSLHGLVISSGEIKRVHKYAFLGIKGPLQALGLPSNALLSVPWSSISTLTALERLDLSTNRIKALGTSDFAGLINLVYLELSNNQITSISQRTFSNLAKLEVLKLGGNRLGDFPTSLKALTQCFNLRELDLTANNLNGPLSSTTIPGLRNLEILNLNRNLIKSIQNKALQNFSRLTSLYLRHNQIDVLQDHAFYGLGSLQNLDLSYNGIVAVSSASLQHLTRLTTLDLTHNFLRALTSDLITPLPSLSELRLAGNDISIVAKNAMDGALELKSLSLQDNPLSCDCTIRPFAEWLQSAKIQAQDLISPTCVTPPRLEGAPLIQVPIESLNCDMDNLEKDNAIIIEQLEALSKQNNSTHIKDLSEEIILHELHYSADYGLILTWILNLNKNDYMCDAIFVYKEENINEILIDNSPIHCESKIINGQNTVSVIVPDSSSLQIGESYRFCLVMVQENNPKADLNVGCSNITALQLSSPGSVPDVRKYQRRPYYTDMNNYDNGIMQNDESKPTHEDFDISQRKFNTLATQQEQHQNHPQAEGINTHTFDFLDSLNKSFLPGLGVGILVTSVVVLIWGATRIRQNTNNSRPSTPTATTCYAASEHIARLADPENGTRYLKLQATTSL
ncbi:leucine-rich repeats and immunoglobulin-like domains protein 3 [Teleopsis dalmanni]|uniref:leucine-rich repeats and immunoglobulin-like domains protein 3 n=1 Tax=Teleopsis dalmanni TaxID=139649 RepID=UPI0018CCB11C|nr:leucine-rich repeats and immunoglobulin-like domains protein 3 [Teleopsis dalmanni]